jgi:hypothetical protein
MNVLFKISSFQAHASTYSHHHLSSENRRIRCLVIVVEVVEAVDSNGLQAMLRDCQLLPDGDIHHIIPYSCPPTS